MSIRDPMYRDLIPASLPLMLLLSCSTHSDPRLEREAEGLIPGTGTRGHTLPPQELRAYVSEALVKTRQVKGYRCTIYKRERVDGDLLGTQKAKLDIRHDPFSVHIRFLEPSSVAGEEAIYVEGSNDGKIVAHSTGILGWLGTVHLDPTGSMAMKGNRYPITDAGMLHLLERFDETCRSGTIEHCKIQLQEGVILDGRRCDRLELILAEPSKDSEFSRIVALFDHKDGVLVHYEAHALQGENGEGLLERHTFTHLILDPGLTDRDFDPKNPSYGY